MKGTKMENKTTNDLILRLHLKPVTVVQENLLPDDIDGQETLVNIYKQGFLTNFKNGKDVTLNDTTINSRYIAAVEICDGNGSVLGAVRNEVEY